MPREALLLVAVDLETTGLSPQEGLILEIGLVVVSDELDVIDQRSWVTSRHLPVELMMNLPPEVIEMHQVSGLFGEIEHGSGVTLSEASGLIEQWWKSTLVPKGRFAAMEDRPVMVGSSVEFDRKWIRAFLGEDFLSLWNYRSVDVLSVKELVRRWRPDCVYTHQGAKSHRALPDCLATLAELAYYRKTVFA